MTLDAPATTPPAPSAVLTADQLFSRAKHDLNVHTDRLFAGLMALQYVGGIIAALVFSPASYDGARSYVHPHVHFALVLGALICFPPILLAFLMPGRATTRYTISVCQALSSALLIHLTGGRPETHFHVFGSLAFLAFYRDWKILVPATLVTAVDHFARGVYLPESVFGSAGAGQWRWVEHAGWVIFEDVILAAACVRNLAEMRATAARTAESFRKNAELTAIRDTALDCIIGMDHHGRITDFNAAAERTFGCKFDQIVGRPLAEVIVPPSHRDAHSRGVETYLRTGHGPVLGKRIEVPAMRADGTEFPAELAVTAVRIDGPPIFVAYMRDITDRKRAEEQARHAEKLSLVASRTDNAVIITDPQGRIEWVNEGFTRVTGYRLDEVIGRKPGSFLQGPDTDPATVARIRQHLSRGEGFTAEIVNYGKTGRRYWLAVEVQPVRDADGTLRHFMAIESDVTERKAAEAALRQSEARYQRMSDNIPGMVYQFVLRPDGTIAFPFVSEGARDVYGMEPDEIRRDANAFVDLIHPDDRAAFDRSVADSAATLTPWRWEGRFIHPRNGDTRWVSGASRPERQPDGSILWDGIVTNITALKRAQTELEDARATADAARAAAERASAAKSQFLANMSHEIRTPLNGVIGMAELLIRKGGLSEQQLRYTSLIKSSGDTLLSLINDVLDFSKVEAGKLELSPVDFDLRSAVEDVVEMLSPKAAAKGLAFTCHVATDLPTRLHGDPDRVRQVLINLVNNAVKFTDAGHVVIRASVVQQDARHVAARFEVRDTGLGIPPDRMDRLFKSFSQVDASTTRKFGGTGLGLAIVKQLAELMGGTVGVESTPGQGSTFWFTARFTIPATPADDRARTHTLAAAMKGMRVLTVDDQPAYLDVLREQLTAWGLDVRTCTSGVEAVEAVRAAARVGQPFRVAIVDMIMPGMDGPTVARAIRDDASVASTSLVMLTAMDNPFDPAGMRAAGFDACLTKPVRHSTLFDTLANVLSTANAPAPSAAAPESAPSPAQTIQAHVLLAEDNEVNQEVAREILADAGCTVEVVGNGAAAVVAAASKRFDLILMDCQMPEMDGFEATRRIRAAGHLQPIIALTANAVAGDRERCLAAGMTDYVSKPIDPDLLLATMRRLLSPAPAVPQPSREDSQPTQTAQPTATPATPGADPIDRASLLNRCRGKATLAAKLLNTFAASADAQLAELRTTLATGDWATFTRVAHTIKGAGANLSATAVSDAAAELERLGKVADAPSTEAALARLEHDLRECIAFIPAAFPDVQTPAANQPAIESGNHRKAH